MREGPLHPTSDSPEHSDDVVSFSAAAVYETVRIEGLHEMHRPLPSLWWSGVAAGIAMIFSVVTPAYIRDDGLGRLGPSVAYSTGFIIVVLGRMQLFTENTVTTVLPLLSEPSWRAAFLTARLWTVVFAANLVGGGAAAGLLLGADLFDLEDLAALFEVCRHGIEGSAVHNFVRAMPAGFLIASVVWLTRVAPSQSFIVVLTLTTVMSLGHFGHVVAGTIEAWFLVLGDGHPAHSAVIDFVIPAFLGNVVGGTGLFALLSYGQVRLELESVPRDGHRAAKSSPSDDV